MFAHVLVDYSKPGASFAHSSGIYVFSLSSQVSKVDGI